MRMLAMRRTPYDSFGEAINYRAPSVVRGKVEGDTGPGWTPPEPPTPRYRGLARPDLRVLTLADRRAIRAVWREYGGYREGNRTAGGLSQRALGEVWGVSESCARNVVKRRLGYPV